MKKKRNPFFETWRALINVTKTLFQKMPILYLVLIYVMDLLVRGYLTRGWSITYLLGLLILGTSIGIYLKTKSFSETTLSFILGILTIYTIDWKTANVTLFVLIYIAYVVLVFFISSIKLAAKMESILTQAASKLDIDNHAETYKRMHEIAHKSTRYNQLSIIDKSEVIRYLAFRKITLGEYETAINLVELIKSVCQVELIVCCEMYYGLYTYCYNRRPTPPNISIEIQHMFDKITTLSLSYLEFFDIFSNTKRILIEEKLDFDSYLFEISKLSVQGYSGLDIVELLKDEYLL